MNEFPIEIRNDNYKLLFGLVRINYRVEDRRPDLTIEQAKISPGYKYKHCLDVYVIGSKKLSWILHERYECEDNPFKN